MFATVHKQVFMVVIGFLLVGGGGCAADVSLDDSSSLADIQAAEDVLEAELIEDVLEAALAAGRLEGEDYRTEACGPPADIWQQLIEEQQRTTNGARAYASYYYTTTHFCDNEPDTDYVFVFRLNYNCNPDSLRWWSDDFLTRWSSTTV